MRSISLPLGAVATCRGTAPAAGGPRKRKALVMETSDDDSSNGDGDDVGDSWDGGGYGAAGAAAMER